MADAETVEFTGETVNKNFIERLEKIIKVEWKVSKSTASKDTTHPTEYKDTNGDAILIPKDKKEEYELLRELIDVLKFDLTNKNEIFRMPMGEMPESMKEFDATAPVNKPYKTEPIEFYITKKGASQLASKDRQYYKLLGIDFPQELYQLIKPNVNIPFSETKFPAPEPERYLEGAKAYEERMIKYYKDNGYEPELPEAGRPPLPHEWITYSDEIPKYNPSGAIARPSYKQHLEELHLTPDLSTNNAPVGLKNGERKKIKSTRLGHHLLTAVKFGKKEIQAKNVLKGLAGIGLGAFGISKFATMLGTGKLPAIVLGQAALKFIIPIVIVLLGYFLYKNYGKKFFRAAKKLLERLIKGKRRSDDDLEHDGEDRDGDDSDDSDDNDDSEGSEPETEPDIDIDPELDAEGFYEEFTEGYKLYVELEGKKKILEGEIAELMVDEEANKTLIEQKMEQKRQIILEQKQWCRNMYQTMAPYARAAHLDPENPGRGMGM